MALLGGDMYLGQRIRQDEKIKIGKNIRRIRKEKKIGQKEMAEKMQLRQIPISRDTYIKLERGDRNIGASELKVIKEVLETTYEVLFEETEEQDESEY